MGFLSIDLGTTNIKVAAYDDQLNNISIVSEPVLYKKNKGKVEFDVQEYYAKVVQSIRNCCHQTDHKKILPIHQIILTGQAESLILLDKEMDPISKGISWLDTRSTNECEELKAHFDNTTYYRITGQPDIIPTWPITKLLWFRRNQPDTFHRISKILLIKDFVLYKLTGILAGELSVYNFSSYLDINKKEYWGEILDFCGINQKQLPQLIEPCTIAGNINPEVADLLGINHSARVNAGALDHFCGMVGTGNIKEGIVSESTGTVMSIATLTSKPKFSDDRVPCHYGPFVDTYVFLLTCESGGISLEWFKSQILPGVSYQEINKEIEKRSLPNELLFLPYITGVNAPDYESRAKGVFFGLQLEHDPYDMAASIMEGLAHLLRKNIDQLEKIGVQVEEIISTGGGARSEIWCQLKANITNRDILVPKNEEAGCFGAAIIGAVTEGFMSSYPEAVSQYVALKNRYIPSKVDKFEEKHKKYNFLYEQLLPVFRSNPS